MHKIKIRLPATITNLGPGLKSLGLALGLYTTVEVSERTDESLSVIIAGEGAKQYDTGLRHPVVLALIRVFQRAERAPLGIDIKIDNQIPLASGLGAETAFTVAGIISANNLLGSPYNRDQLLNIAAQINSPDGVVTAILGGLTASAHLNDALVYRSLALAPQKLVIALPSLSDYHSKFELPDRVNVEDAIHNLSQLPLLVEALQTGDLALLSRTLNDRLYAPFIIPALTGYTEAVEAAQQAGAKAVTLCGNGPAMVAFAENNHDDIVQAIQDSFRDKGISARAWVLSTDNQGIVMSMMQSS